jgi:hypothetical protein
VRPPVLLYFGSLNEILASLVCIINIVRFEFQIQTLFFYSNQAFWHLYCNSNSWKKVCPTKFSFVKNKLRWIFSEFTRFFHKDGTPLKFIENSKCNLF